MKKRSAIILVLGIIMITSAAISTTILPVSVVEGGKDKDDEENIEEMEEQARKELEAGDTLSEVLSSFPKKAAKDSEYLSELWEEYEMQQYKKTVQFPDTTERDVAEMCGASEDFEAHEELCRDLYQALEDGRIPDDPDFEYH